MDQSELKYSIRVDKDAFFIRFYVWLWEANREKINFCKLFWGYVFAAPALVIRGLLGCLRLVGRALLVLLAPARKTVGATKRLHDRLHRRRWERECKPLVIELPAPTQGEGSPHSPTVMSRGLGLVEHGGTIAAMRLRESTKTAKRVSAVSWVDTRQKAREILAVVVARATQPVGRVVSTPTFGKGLLVAGAMVGVTAVTFGAIHAIPPTVGAATLIADQIPAATSEAGHIVKSPAAIGAGIGLFAAFFGVGLVLLFVTLGFPMLVMKYCIDPAAKPIVRGGAVGGRTLKNGFAGFAEALHIGYHAVKTSTCPRIELEERPDHEKTVRVERELGL